MNRALCTRLVRRRNFAGFPFLASASPEACAALAKLAADTAAAQGFEAGILLAECPPAMLGRLREQDFLPERPVTFPGIRPFKSLFRKSVTSEHVLFGETEHWTHVHTLPGLPAFVPQDTAAHPPFARSATYGFLTSQPAFAGTGLQIEAALHLPALAVLAGNGRPGPGMPGLLEVQRALGAQGFDLRPLSLKTPGCADAGYFRMISRGGMDFPEETLYEHFAAKANHVLAVEAGALEQWRKRDPNELEDRVYRALRLLQEARRMEHSELLACVSQARMGVYLGLFPVKLLDLLETLRVEAGPFSLRNGVNTGTESETDGGASSEAPFSLEVARAVLARRLLAGIQPL